MIWACGRGIFRVHGPLKMKVVKAFKVRAEGQKVKVDDPPYV